MEIINNNTFIDFGMKPINHFMNGNIADNYTIQEQQGFPIQGAVGTILNVDKDKKLDNVNNGLVINTDVSTNNNQIFNSINRKSSNDNNWVNPNTPQPPTPILYCGEKKSGDDELSELLPYYPNGIPNVNVNPNCKTLTLNGVGSPLLYGASTFGVNDSSLLTNPQNNIGHEIETFGISNEFGSRALGQGKNACKPMMPGFNVPTLKTNKNKNNTYISSPTALNKHIPLYQVGDWTKIPGNFLNNFENLNFCN